MKSKNHTLICIRVKTKDMLVAAKKVKAEPINSVIERALEALNK
jgi:hypothetical protein